MYLYHPQVRRQVDATGAVWTRWSRLEKIEVRNSGVPALGQALGFNTIGKTLNRADTWSFSVGTLPGHPEWVLRTGFAYEPSPTTNEDRNVRIPAGDRAGLHRRCRLGFRRNQNERRRGLRLPVENHRRRQPEGTPRPAYSAKYDNSAWLARPPRSPYRFDRTRWSKKPGIALVAMPAPRVIGDGFFDGGLELRIVRGGSCWRTARPPCPGAIHHVLVGPARAPGRSARPTGGTAGSPRRRARAVRWVMREVVMPKLP